MSKPPIACLNEVLLRAALRAERINSGRLLDEDASLQAKRNDVFAQQYHHRVTFNITQGLRDDNPTAVSVFNES